MIPDEERLARVRSAGPMALLRGTAPPRQ
jgi:hypothetical protein